MIYKTKGIIIRRQNLGEADRIITILTENYGLIRVLAKGVRKTLSKLAGHLEPFCLTEFLIAEGRNLDIISGAVVKKCHLKLRGNLELTQTAYYFGEIINQLLAEKEKHENVFWLLDETLDNLDDGLGVLMLSYFELNFLSAIGFFPELEKCVHCDQKLGKINYFDPVSGGVNCNNCKNGREISIDAIKTLRLFLKHRLLTISKIKTNEALVQELSEITSDYLVFINQKDFKSRKLLVK